MFPKYLALQAFSVLFMTSCVQSNQQNNIGGIADFAHAQDQTLSGDVQHQHPYQMNCTDSPKICNVVCNETKPLPWSVTFCDKQSGSCICDCRDSIPKDCEQTPFTPCFQECVRKNPNPDVYLYEGGNCPVPQKNGTVYRQCACECTIRDDYEEVNDVM